MDLLVFILGVVHGYGAWLWYIVVVRFGRNLISGGMRTYVKRIDKTEIEEQDESKKDNRERKR